MDSDAVFFISLFYLNGYCIFDNLRTLIDITPSVRKCVFPSLRLRCQRPSMDVGDVSLPCLKRVEYPLNEQRVSTIGIMGFEGDWQPSYGQVLLRAVYDQQMLDA